MITSVTVMPALAAVAARLSRTFCGKRKVTTCVLRGSDRFFSRAIMPLKIGFGTPRKPCVLTGWGAGEERSGPPAECFLYDKNTSRYPFALCYALNPWFQFYA